MTPYILIVVANIISQGFLFILTGTFWDDFAYLDYSIETLYHQFLATGTPERIFYIQSVWSIPNYGYRIIVWICYCLTSIMYYMLLKRMGVFTQKDSLIITMIFITVPLNACRLTLCTVVYAFSMLLFSSAFFLLVCYLKCSKSIFFRLLSLLLFFFSFFLNSNLFFYLIPYIYVICNSSGGTLNKLTHGILRKVVVNFDFTILPLVFFVIKGILFPTYGNYAEYNHFGFYELISGAVYTVIGVVPQILSIGKCYLFNDFLFLFVIPLICLWLIKRKKIYMGVQKLKNSSGLLLSGALMLMMAAYPYLVVRQSYLVAVNGVNDRDSILLPIGWSILIYSFCRIISRNQEDVAKFCMAFILLGAVATNINYLKFQGVEYWQQSLATNMKKMQTVKDNNTFLFIYEPHFDADYGIRFYSLNGISSFYAFDKQDKCWLNGVGDLKKLNNITDYEKGYCMDDYDFGDTSLDGVVIYKCKYSLDDIVKMKIYEMFCKQKYRREIESHGEMFFLDINTAEANKVIEEGGCNL